MSFDAFHAASSSGVEENVRFAPKEQRVTTTHASLARSEVGGAPPNRVIERRAGLPGGRAVVGALLMAIAAVGIFLAYADATEAPSDPVVVAARALRVGDTIGADDLRTVQARLPGDVIAGAFDDPATLVGRVVLGPIAAAEIVQGAAVTDDRSSEIAHEVAVTLPRGQIAVGRLKQGERVDLFVTAEERTASVVRGAQVVQISDGDDGSLTNAREVTLVVAVPSGDAVAALVHALRTGDVTVVRSTLAEAGSAEPLEFQGADPGEDDEAGG